MTDDMQPVLDDRAERRRLDAEIRARLEAERAALRAARQSNGIIRRFTRRADVTVIRITSTSSNRRPR